MAAVSVKLVLAESLSVLKHAEEREAQTDKELERMSKAPAREHDFPKIKRMYSSVYDTYIRGLELMNFCRRTGIDKGDGELANFGAEKMKFYMDRCEKLRSKETNVLTSVDQADNGESVLKEGYSFGEYLFVHQRKQGIKNGQPINFSKTLEDGSYYLQVKNYDDYNVAAPTVRIQLQIVGKTGAQVRQQKIIPSRTCWSKYIGIVQTGQVTFSVLSDAMLRESHVEVTLRQLIPPSDAEDLKRQLSEGPKVDTTWVDSLPPLPNLPTSGIPGTLGQPGTTLPPVDPPTRGGFATSNEAPTNLPPANIMAGFQDEEAVPRRSGNTPPPQVGVAPAASSNGAVQHTDSETLLQDLQVPGGSVGSPVLTSPVDSLHQLSNLQVPYRQQTPTNADQGTNFVSYPNAPNHDAPPPYPQQSNPPPPAATVHLTTSTPNPELEPVVNPKDKTLRERLDRVMKITHSYEQNILPPQIGDATKLSAEHRTVVNAISQMPHPTELGVGEPDIGELNLDLADLEGGL
jgi:hypothetical protein